MYDLICDVITYCVLSCDMGKINASDKIMFRNQKNRENIHQQIVLESYFNLTNKSNVTI